MIGDVVMGDLQNYITKEIETHHIFLKCIRVCKDGPSALYLLNPLMKAWVGDNVWIASGLQETEHYKVDRNY